MADIDTPFGAFTNSLPLPGDWLVAERGENSGVGVNLPLYAFMIHNADGNWQIGGRQIVVGDDVSAGVFSSGSAFGAGGGAVIARGKASGYNAGGVEVYAGTAATSVERVAIKGDGNVSIGAGVAASTAAGGIRYLDIFNHENTDSGSGVDLRLLTQSADGSGLCAVDLVKSRNGSFLISNTEPGSNSTIVFATRGAARWMVGAEGHLMPSYDNIHSLGTGFLRASQIFAATGAINTSDEREKVWRGAADAAELRAARRIIGELGFYQWQDAVAEKGADDARLHFGARAQRVWQIMADEGLVDPIGPDGRPGATRYAFLCFDEWDDRFEDEYKMVPRVQQQPIITRSTSILGPDGTPAETMTFGEPVEIMERVPTGRQILVQPAGDRFGLRIDQLALFMVAALGAQLAALEA